MKFKDQRDVIEIVSAEKNHYNYEQLTNYTLMVLKIQKMKFKELNNLTYINHLDLKMYLNKEMLLKLLVLKKNHYNYKQLPIIHCWIKKQENEVQKIEEIELLRTSIPENVIEQRDSLEIITLEKEPLVYQIIDELFIATTVKPENEFQRIEE